MILFGISTCDTCRKAFKALEGAGKDVTFQDIRKQELDQQTLDRFLADFGDALVNRKSTTWRGLDDAQRELDARTLLLTHPTLMKRPVIDDLGKLHLGWTAEVQKALGV